jgi:hypothetical protein
VLVEVVVVVVVVAEKKNLVKAIIMPMQGFLPA